MKALSLFTALWLGSFLLAVGSPPEDKMEHVVGIHVVRSDGESFFIPASGRVFGVIRVSGEGNLSALKVVPQADGETVTVRLSPFFSRMEEALTCAQLWEFRSDPTVTLVGRVGDRLSVSGFERFALAPLGVHIVRVNRESAQNCCECGRLVCRPNPGQCLGCGICGQCCLRP